MRDGRCIDPSQPGDCEPCGAHAFCDVDATPDVCTCAPGYDGDPCAFTALIADPGFELPLERSPWSDEKSATILLSLGDRDPGEALLVDSVICNAGGLVQTVEAPTVTQVEPEVLVADVNYWATGVHGIAIGFGRSWTRLPAAPTWTPVTFCLGEGAYGTGPNGGEVEVRVSASERQPGCFPPASPSEIRVDHFTIRPSREIRCPTPGEVVNGTAELNGQPWRFQTEGDVEAGFESAVGRDGTGGARLFRAAGQSGRAAMTTKLSVPLPSEENPSPALRFWWRGASDGLYDVTLGTMVDFDDPGRRVDRLVGTSSGLSYIYCLPPWAHGSVLDLSFSLPAEGSSTVELVVDDVEIKSDPDCGVEDELLDPSFESAPNRWPGVVVGSSQQTVLLQPGTGLARSGSGLLELSYEDPDADLAMETYVLVPQSGDEAGPAVTFYSQAPATVSTTVEWVLGRSEIERGEVQTEVTWERNEVCLPPHWAGRWFRLQVGVNSPTDLLRQERVLLDDFSLGTSPSCPHQ